MFDIGRIVVKISGKDAGKIAVIVDNVDKNTVLIDGNVKRRKCSTSHIEPLSQVLDIKKGASTDEVKKLLEQHKLFTKKKKAVSKKKERKKTARPVRIRKKKVKEAVQKGKGKKAPKKSEDEMVEEALEKV